MQEGTDNSTDDIFQVNSRKMSLLANVRSTWIRMAEAMKLPLCLTFLLGFSCALFAETDYMSLALNNKGVPKEYVPYLRQLPSGEIRLMRSADGRTPLHISSPTPFSTSVLPYSQWELVRAPHSHELPPAEKTILHIDAKQLGIGGASCGPPPMKRDWVRADTVDFEFSIFPVGEA